MVSLKAIRPSNWPFIWKFSIPTAASVILIACLATVAILALQAQSKRTDQVVKGALENAVFLGQVRAELRGDARDLYSTLAARAAGDLQTGSVTNATKVSDNLKALNTKVLARAKATNDKEDAKSLQDLAKEIGTQKDSVDFVASMLEIDLPAAMSFLGPYAASEQNTDQIAQKVIARTNAKATELAQESVASAQRDTMLVIVISVMAALVSAVIGVVIGRSTSKSVTAIADTTRRLANDDMSVDPKSLARLDELGKVVEALSVFKQLKLESQALSAESEKEARARLERTSQMEGLIEGFKKDFSDLIRSMDKASGHLDQSATILTSTAADNTKLAHTAVNAIFHVRDSMSGVAAASEELGATISEVDRQATASANVANDASERADSTQRSVVSLSEAILKINDIINLISNVAKQTNLLALNATIEAARAGEAGRGFAVVAHEVKSLADQTTKATEDIRSRISEVQAAANITTTEITAITSVIEQMRGISENTSESVRQQVQATQEITSSLATALKGAGEATTSIERLNQSAEQTGEVSLAVTEASESLTQQSDRMKNVVETFLARAGNL